ncbi:MAG: HEAT repeat domain-containing protein [Acidobacteriaceae bacterium]|nr:HEAT repeat domain-containing protein [Acidobacteriaceae bacterium]
MDKRLTPALLKSRVLPALLAGANRRSMDLDALFGTDADQPRLRALSLTGQALRFERPSGPEHYLVEPEIRDDRRIIPDEMRRPLIRLLTFSKATPPVAAAIAWTMDKAQLRLHPFDQPKLDAFIRANSEYLGSTAEQWATRQAETATTLTYFFAEDELDENNWNTAQLRQRVHYLESRRKLDPDAARALLEAAWPQQDAEARVRLLIALQAGLGIADEPFLASLAKDRSPRVRSMAAQLLGRLPNSTYENPALRQLMERVQRSESGIFRKKTVLALELPTTVKEHIAPAWIRESVVSVSLQEFSRAVSLTNEELIAGSAKDRNLLLGLAWMATQGRRLDLLPPIAAEHPELWEQMSLSGSADLEHLSVDERVEWATAITSPQSSKPPKETMLWNWLHNAIKGPVPTSLMDGMLRSRWTEDLTEPAKARPDLPEMLAACCPGSLRTKLREQLGTLDPSLTVNAFSLLDILDTMERFTQ